jgi:hypothetical protein
MPSARLLSHVAFPHARRLINAQTESSHSGPAVLVPVALDGRLLVYELGRLLGGDTAPVVEFPVPADAFQHSAGVIADRTTAVFPIVASETAVRAIDPTGAVRWEWRYHCSAGTCRVVGGQVWTIVLPYDDRNGPTGPAELVVLDASDGHLLGRAALSETVSETGIVPHPDGRQVGVFSVDETSSDNYVAGFVDGAVGVDRWDFGADETLIGIDPGGSLAQLVQTDGRYVRLRDLATGQVLSTRDSESGRMWYQYGGFLDPGLLIVADGAIADDHGSDARHWLWPAGPEAGIEPVAYPTTEPILAHLWALGDLTWLTADPTTLYHWTLA